MLGLNEYWELVLLILIYQVLLRSKGKLVSLFLLQGSKCTFEQKRCSKYQEL